MKIFKTKMNYLFLIISIGILASNCQKSNAGETSGVYEISSVSQVPNFPDFTWEVEGKKVSFKEFTKGKVVFLNVWGTWCGPCRREIPDIIEIAKDLKDKDFVIIGIASERQVSTAKEKVSNYVKKAGINYINLLDNKQELASLLRIEVVPTTFMIGKDGKVAEVIRGGKSKAGFMQSINQILE